MPRQHLGLRVHNFRKLIFHRSGDACMELLTPVARG
jgi:hypothetical protein